MVSVHLPLAMAFTVLFADTVQTLFEPADTVTATVAPDVLGNLFVDAIDATVSVLPFVTVVLVVFVTFAGVTVTVSEQVPAFRPLMVVDVAEQIFFDAVATTTDVFEPLTTVVPAVVRADTTVSVLPRTTVGVFTTTGVTVVAVGAAVVGVDEPPDEPPDEVELPPELTRALNAPPPVPAARLSELAMARTPKTLMLALLTLSAAVGGTSRSCTAPVFFPVEELLSSLTASVGGVTALVGVDGALSDAVIAAPVVPNTVKLVSTALISPLPDATAMTTSPVEASACSATADAELPCPPGPGAGAADAVLIFVNVVPSSEKYIPSEPAPSINPVSQSTFKSL